VTRAGSLQQLLTLRSARLQRAESALARQHAQCETARALVEAATARVVAHRDRQRQRERALLDELRTHPVTITHIERLRMTFALLDEQAADLERAEREADHAMRAAFELKDTLAVDRNRRRREQDKMAGIVAHAHQAARRREELYAEAEREERTRPAAIAERKGSC
jgi:type III secretion protein O